MNTSLSDEEINDKLKKGKIPSAIKIVKNCYENQNSICNEESIHTYDLVLQNSAASSDASRSVSLILSNIISSINNGGTSNTYNLINLKTETIEGRKYKQIDFILPGQLAFALLSNAMYGISFTFLSLKQQLVLKRIFAAPVSKGVVIASEATSKLILALMQSIIIISVGYFMFDFTLANGFTTFISLILLSLIGIITFLSLGFLTSAVAKSEDSVTPIANLIMMPQLFLSGAFFQIEAFPKFLQTIAKYLPMTFLNDSLKTVAFEGSSIFDTWPQILGLVVWAIVIYAIDIIIFKWE